MIIKRLTLHNFGVYAGTNVFDFSAKKPIVLVGGMNGRGKTTFLEAVLLALYGKNSFAYTENEKQTYGQYLRSYINKGDGSNETYVELAFYMNSDGTEEYTIRRQWNGNLNRIFEDVSVSKDGLFNQFLTDNWAMFMENVLPSGLSGFFFFDGEKIATLAGENTSEQMKESIKALLGITVLDHLENDLNRVVSRIAKNSVNKDEANELDELRKKKEVATEILNSLDLEIKALSESLDKVQKEIDKTNEEYIAKGGDIVNQRQELLEKRMEFRAQSNHISDDLYVAAASELPLVLVKDLLVNIRVNAEVEHDRKTITKAVNKMKKELPAYLKDSGSKTKEIEKFLDFFESNNVRNDDYFAFNLSDTSLTQVQQLLDQKLLDKKLETSKLQEIRKNVQQEADQIDSYLSVDIDEKAIAKLYKKIKKHEQEKIEIESKMELAQEKRKNANGTLILSTAEFNKKVESYLKKVELNDDGDRIIKYANVATAIIDKYRVALQKSKVSEVADTMTKCYKLLASKKTLIDKIEMDYTSLDMIYKNKQGEEVPRQSLSAGEKQMMVIALLWALAICSKKKLPVIIDTPLSRLDSTHRQALIKTYFPKASDQTIILSTDSEIDDNYYKMMKSNIGDEFTLEYDDESKSTSIKKGYFGGR